MEYLVDSNVLSELCRRSPDPEVEEWAEGAGRVGLSAITLEELRFGLSLKPAPRIEKWLEGFLGDCCEVLVVDEEVARRGGDLRGSLARQGSTRTQADCLVAATALIHGLTLVTRNVRDFQGCGLKLLNPFRRPAT